MSRLQTFLFILVFIFASFVRLWNLGYPDLISDELHYIEDAQRFDRGDPYISFRHHTFQHPKPNIGHPFLAPALSSYLYKVVGYSVETARLPSVVAGLMTILILCFFDGPIGRRTALVSAALFSIMPFAIRFNKDAHLDSFFALWITLVALCIWRFHLGHEKKWLIFSGLFAGLALSTKLDGVVAPVLAISLLLIAEKRKGFRNRFSNLLFIITPALGIWFLLNDPSAYFDGILHPADPSFGLSNWIFWKAGIQSIPFWVTVMASLLSPLVFLIWIFSFFSFFKQRSFTSKFLFTWQGILLPLFLLHRPGVSGEYGLLPIVPAIAMSVAYIIGDVSRKKLMFLFFTVALFSYEYGLRISPVPYYPKDSVFNRTVKDHFYRDVVDSVNMYAPKDGMVFLLPKEGIPTFALRPDIHWSYFGDLTSFDLFVVDKQELLDNLSFPVKQIAVIDANQDGSRLVRYIYQNKHEAN